MNGGGSEDCTLVGDEDGSGLADCEEQVCDGQIVNLQGSYNLTPATCEYGQGWMQRWKTTTPTV